MSSQRPGLQGEAGEGHSWRIGLGALLAVSVVAFPAPVGADDPGGESVGGTEVRGEGERSGSTAEDSEERSFSGTVRTGIEYDSNASRTGVDRAVADVLSRYFAVLEGRLPAPEQGRLTFELRHGGKLFARERGSDTLLTDLRLRYRHRLSRRAYALVDASTKDRLERRSAGVDLRHQDYNRGGGEVGVGMTLGPVDGFVTAGWRYFAFRPNPASSNHGPEGTTGLSVGITERVRARARYTFSYRNFRALRFVRREGEDGDPLVQRDRSGTLRNDRLHVGRIGASYRGPFILELDYRLLRNNSNSYGQAITRHGVELRGTAPLPWRLYLSGEVQIQRTNYQDPLFLSADLQVDEENRNSVVVSLTRVVGENWELEGRYRLFVEEFGAASDYRRQTASLGVGYLF